MPILSVPGLPPSMPVQTFGMDIGSNPSLSRQSRKLYIVSITTDLDEQNLADFFNGKITGINTETRGPGNPVLAVQCNYEKGYGSVEVVVKAVTLVAPILMAPQFRSPEDATAAIAFEAIILIDDPLKIRRPKDQEVLNPSDQALMFQALSAPMSLV